jgi:hypothetical protein
LVSPSQRSQKIALSLVAFETIGNSHLIALPSLRNEVHQLATRFVAVRCDPFGTPKPFKPVARRDRQAYFQEVAKVFNRDCGWMIRHDDNVEQNTNRRQVSFLDASQFQQCGYLSVAGIDQGIGQRSPFTFPRASWGPQEAVGALLMRG